MSEQIHPPSLSRSYGFMSLTALAVAAVVALAAAWGALVAIERSTHAAVSHALYLAGEDWAKVETNGLQVILHGNAPSEAARFSALSEAAHVVDGARVIDQMVLPDAVPIVPPHFSIEMLRNQAGITVIGLIPGATDREALRERMQEIDPDHPVSDFLETSAHPAPEGWDAALDFSFYAAGILPQSKISMSADLVAIEGIAPSPAEKAKREKAIRRERPAGLKLDLDIRSPHEVVSPFIMRFLSDAQGTRFDACTAHNEAGRQMIRAAGIAAGVSGEIECRIGLGVPSPAWAEAVARGIRAVSDLGGGALTFSDADITLIAPEDTAEDLFDRVIGELEADLPAVFSLHGVRPVSDTGPALPAGPPVFTASLGESGMVQLRGRVASAQDRTVVESLARASFGTNQVYAPLRLDESLPANWTMRTLAGLEALGHLATGKVAVRPDVVEVTGSTGEKAASTEISRLLSEKLGSAEDYRVDVTYVEALDPAAAMPTPQECAADINAVLADNKITFAPGSAEIERGSLETVDRIAEIVKTCPDVAMEIGGYTDSQGREEMNKALSQRRAEAVVSALLARRVLTTNLTAYGYGEEYPIADNDTEEGREANRRIEFSLVGETRPHGEAGDGSSDGTGEVPAIRPRPRPEGLGQAPAEEETALEAAPEATAKATPEAETATDTGAPEAVEEVAPKTVTAPEAAPAEMPEGTETPEGAAGEEVAPKTVTAPEAAPAEMSEEAETPEGTAGEEVAPKTVTAPEAAPAEMPEGAGAPEGAGEAEIAPAPVAPEAPIEPTAATTPDAMVEPVAETTPQPEAVTEAPPTAEAAPTPETGTGPAPNGETPPVPAPTAVLETVPEVPAGIAVEDIAPPAFVQTIEMGAPPAAVIEAAPESVALSEPDPAPPTEPVSETPAESVPNPPAEAPGTSAQSLDTPPWADPDMPRIRPMPRPPIVVHPKLKGIRPRPRPAEIPDLPSTE